MIRAPLIICFLFATTSFCYVINNQKYQNKRFKCGTKSELNQASNSSAWPWSVALLDSGEKFFCSATLISSNKIISSKFWLKIISVRKLFKKTYFYLAARCLHHEISKEKRLIGDNSMILGLSNVNELLIADHQPHIAKPDEIIIHKNWSKSRFSNADIAILLTAEDVPFSDFIKPICIWQHSFDIIVEDSYIFGLKKYQESQNIH